jgi:hypothetical protein
MEELGHSTWMAFSILGPMGGKAIRKTIHQRVKRKNNWIFLRETNYDN